MALDLTTATSEELIAELSKYSIERRLLVYQQTEEKLLTIGQENWNGDKKHFEARLREVQLGIENCQKQLARKRANKRSPMRSYNVSFN